MQRGERRPDHAGGRAGVAREPDQQIAGQRRLARGLASYRLLDTTRAFATRKLREAEPVNPVFRRHALEVHDKLVAADSRRDGMLLAASLTEHGGHIEDVRAALDWCFSEGGELQIGIEIMAFAMPIHELGVLAEQVDRIERALNHLRLLEPPRPDLELRLNLVLAWPSVEPGWRGQRTLAILSRAAQLAERMADSASRILALYSTWLGSFVTGDYVGATAAAESALEVALTPRTRRAWCWRSGCWRNADISWATMPHRAATPSSRWPATRTARHPGIRASSHAAFRCGSCWPACSGSKAGRTVHVAHHRRSAWR